MEELIKALEKVLERGIVIEPVTWGSSPWAGSYRIRLSPEQTRTERPDPTIPDNQATPTAQGGLTW